jgi:hypothetical protein
MIKRASRKPYFQFRIWYDRFFVISKQPQLLKIFKQEGKALSCEIDAKEILKINDLNEDSGGAERCPMKYSFKLVTQKRVFLLFAPTRRERDLWVQAFNQILHVPVERPPVESEYDDPSDDNEL